MLQRYPDIEVVAEASDGDEAIKLTDDLVPDVVLMDIGMPNVSTTIERPPAQFFL